MMAARATGSFSMNFELRRREESSGHMAKIDLSSGLQMTLCLHEI